MLTFHCLEERGLKLLVLDQGVVDEAHGLKGLCQVLLRRAIREESDGLDREIMGRTHLLQEESEVVPTRELALAVGAADVVLVKRDIGVKGGNDAFLHLCSELCPCGDVVLGRHRGDLDASVGEARQWLQSALSARRERQAERDGRTCRACPSSSLRASCRGLCPCE